MAAGERTVDPGGALDPRHLPAPTCCFYFVACFFANYLAPGTMTGARSIVRMTQAHKLFRITLTDLGTPISAEYKESRGCSLAEFGRGHASTLLRLLRRRVAVGLLRIIRRLVAVGHSPGAVFDRRVCRLAIEQSIGQRNIRQFVRQRRSWRRCTHTSTFHCVWARTDVLTVTTYGFGDGSPSIKAAVFNASPARDVTAVTSVDSVWLSTCARLR